MLAFSSNPRRRAAPGHEACSGCSLCLLGCPVWRQRRDIRLTPQGRAKALQHGAGSRQIAASVESCTLCGSCEPACPENIGLMDMILELRREQPLGGDRVAAMPGAANAGTSQQPRQHYIGRTVLIADAPLRVQLARVERVRALLDAAVLADDDGADIALALEAGVPLPPERQARFLEALSAARRIVVADGGLLRALRGWLPRSRITGLGEALSALPALRSRLRSSDLYVIEARAFHYDWRRLLAHYDRLRADLGCEMNLDLQRLAVPTTASSAQHALGLPAIDPAEQARWILEGRDPRRIVVEDAADIGVFSGVTDRPVVHIADL